MAGHPPRRGGDAGRRPPARRCRRLAALPAQAAHAAEPLSLQTHPSTAQARAGFDAEELAGIALDDPTRTYRDRLAKPELLVALTPFVALCGFRPLDTSTALLAAIGADDLATRLTRDGLAATVAQLYHGEFAIGPTVARCAASPIAEARLVTQLATRYPADPSALVALLLNRLELRPGQSVYLTPGNLHAYVSGTAVEIMGDSDNVIRGGLTTKHVDVIALLDLLDYAPLSDPFVHPVAHGPHAVHYPTPGAPFALDRIDVPAGHTYESPATGRELWLVLGNHDPGCWYVAAGELGRVAGGGDDLPGPPSDHLNEPSRTTSATATTRRRAPDPAGAPGHWPGGPSGGGPTPRRRRRHRHTAAGRTPHHGTPPRRTSPRPPSPR
ncbi:MAG: type I phosphomannose isomerase catalytic subunit [Ilumatobacteraceae bacterium]